jgi:cytochrome c-type biogenesis protein CcmH
MTKNPLNNNSRVEKGSREGTVLVHGDPRSAAPLYSFFRRWGLQPPRTRAGNPWAAAPEVRSHNLKRIVLPLFIVAFAVAPLWAQQITYSPHAKQIATHLKCLCRGCDMSAGLCAHPGGAFSGPCDPAKGMMAEVDQHLAKGESEQQIIDAFVAKYGSIVYVEPPKTGFGLVAWLMPVFYSVVGFGLLVLVVRKMRNRQLSAIPGAPAVHSAALDRARAQAARETED